MAAFKSMGKGIRRLDQKIQTKIGTAQETVDVQFNQHLDRYKVTYDKVENLIKDIFKLAESMRAIMITQTEMIHNFRLAYDKEGALCPVVDHQAAMARACNAACAEMLQRLRANCIEPLSRYMGYFYLMEERVALRQTRMVDMDRYTKGIAAKSKKDKATFDHAYQKMEGAKMAYEELNEELKHDLPNLCNQLAPFFDYAFATLLTVQSEFMTTCASMLESTLPSVQYVDVELAKAHQPVITDKAVSTVARIPNRSTVPEVRPAPIAVLALAPPSAPAAAARNSASRPLPVPAPAASAPVSHAPPVQVHQPQQAAPAATARATNPLASAAAAQIAQRRMTPTPPVKPVVPAAAGPPIGATKAVAQWDFDAADEHELPFHTGDTLYITKQEGEWWEGWKDGRKGLLPGNYVKFV